MTRSLVVTLALFAILFVVAIVRGGEPFPRGTDEPVTSFSAARAREIQRALVEVSPRPSGSDGNARARAILIKELDKLGWKTETETGMSCGRHGACGLVTNVIATRPGTDPSLGAVMMAAHYDAVPCSFGANDDGIGSAALVEAARAITAAPPLPRTVIALFTDGEEDGLLGAELFAREHVLWRTVRATVNVDSRGGAGPSMMFETSANNAWMIALFRKNIDRPVTTSIFSEVYRRLPNDTDFSVYRTRSAGVNFGNARRIENYHTRLDALENSELGTLQHHGDQVLAMTRAFATADLEHPPRGDAVWFDVLAFFLVAWPLSWTQPLAILALALVLGQTIRLRVRNAAKIEKLGIFVFGVTAIGAVLASIVAASVMRAMGSIPATWVAHPAAALLCIHFAALTVGGAGALFLARRSTPEVLWSGTWIAWAAAGVTASFVAPGASYIVVVPAIVAGLAAFAPMRIAAPIPAAVAAILFLPISSGLYDTVGFMAAPALALATIMLLTTLAPMLGAVPRRTPLVTLAIALVALIVAKIVPSFSAEHPQRVNVELVQDGARATSAVTAAWVTFPWGDAPPVMVSALGGSTVRKPVLPWLAAGETVDGPAIDAKPPVIEVVSTSNDGGSRHVTAHVRSQRGAITIVLEVSPAPAVRSITMTVNHHRTTQRFGVLVLHAVPDAGMDVDLTAAGPEPIAITVRDVTSGVPAGTPAGAAAAARPSNTVETQEGNVTVLVTHASL